MAATTAPLTADEFFRLPDPGRPAELVRGEIVMMNLPGARHGHVCANISFELRSFLDAHPQGTVLTNDAGIVTKRDPDSVRGADVAFYSYGRIARGEMPVGYPRVAPELVFEVLSPSDEWAEALAKVAEYLKAGVVTVCLVDPETETVIAYFLNKIEQAFRGDDALVLPDVLPRLSIPVRKLFHA